MTTKHAIGYIRVSTAHQAEDGVSIDAQRERIAAWCIAHGYELKGIHTDAGISGGRADNRPGLQAALDEACGRTGAALVVYSLSRLARSTKDTINIAERLQRHDADLVSLSESIDTTTAAGKMVFRMLAVLAEFEKDLASERTTAALQHKRAQGQKTGGSVPFGYKLDDDGVHLVAEPNEQGVIDLIVDLRRDGLSYRDIADELVERGFSPKAGDTWHPKVIRSIYLRAEKAAA